MPSLAAPVWLVALVLAAVAPWCVRALESSIEQRARRKTAAVLARADGTGARTASGAHDTNETRARG
jgi:hypothetical protein